MGFTIGRLPSRDDTEDGAAVNCGPGQVLGLCKAAVKQALGDCPAEFTPK